MQVLVGSYFPPSALQLILPEVVGIRATQVQNGRSSSEEFQCEVPVRFVASLESLPDMQLLLHGSPAATILVSRFASQ